MTYRDPEPWDPDDSWQARLDRGYNATAARQAADRVAKARRDFERQHPRPEGRHTGEDNAAHHWADHAVPQNRPRCGCGCQDAGPPLRGTPVDGVLDQLSRQRFDPSEIKERAYTEERAYLELPERPVTPLEALVWLNAHPPVNRWSP